MTHVEAKSFELPVYCETNSNTKDSLFLKNPARGPERL